MFVVAIAVGVVDTRGGMALQPSSSVVAFVLLFACGPSSSPGDGGGEGSSSSSSSSGASSTDEDGQDVSTGTVDVTSGDSSTGFVTGESGPHIECEPDVTEACEVDGCTAQWEYTCSECVRASAPDCFAVAHDCAWPLITCDLPMPCSQVWIQGDGTLEAFEDESAAVCLLEALNARTVGRFELLYGIMEDVGLVYITLFSNGDGTVLVQYQDTCAGCPNSGFVGRSGALELREPEFFEACLAAPQTAGLIECLVGFTEFEVGAPPPLGWTPPFTTGACTGSAWTCPAR